jgi:hypothetical protein
VCVAEVALAVMLWTGAPAATALSFVLLPFEIAVWIGFTLPLGPPLGIARKAWCCWRDPTDAAPVTEKITYISSMSGRAHSA